MKKTKTLLGATSRVLALVSRVVNSIPIRDKYLYDYKYFENILFSIPKGSHAVVIGRNDSTSINVNGVPS